MKGNIYIYAMLIVLLAAIVVLIVNFTSGLIPRSRAREGSTIYVSQYSFGFSPDYIELKKGENVTLKVKSEGGDHYFVIDQYSIKTPVSPGKEVSINLYADKGGDFIYYDFLPGHNESGEHGLLAVNP